MNSPFPPTDPSSASGDEPALRALLDAEARRQPPASADLRAGVDRRLRRRRMRIATAAVPIVALVLGGAAMLAPRSTPDTTLATAAQTAGEQDAPDAPEPDVTAPEPAVVAPGEAVDCGSVQIGPERVDPEKGPLDCFVDAFNAGTDARIVVVVDGADGGSLTQTVTTASRTSVSVAVTGSLSMKLPSIGFGGGLVDPGSDVSPVDCGTVNVSEATGPGAITPEVGSCLLGLFTSASGGGLTMVTTDEAGSTLTVRIDVSADRLVTISIDGDLTASLPEGVTIPSDLTDHLPPNGIGLDELGLGGRTGSFGDDQLPTTTTTVPGG